MTDKLKVAVVILNYQGEYTLPAFLPTVLKYSKKEGVEIFVIDNDSTDESFSMMLNRFNEAKLIVLGKNYGFADGYNYGLENIRAEYYVLLNSDVEVTPGWLDPLLEYMEAHPETAACQPKILSHKNKTCFEYAGACGGYIDRYGYPFCRGRILDNVEKDKGQYDEIRPIFWATGAALFIRSADYWEAGGLDGRFFAHMEEIDLCWRLRSRGRGIVCVPRSVVYHVGGETFRQQNVNKTILNFRNNLLMLYKNLPDNEYKQVMFVRTLLDYVAVARFWLSGQRSQAKAVLNARRQFFIYKPYYAASRAENLAKTTVPEIPERLGKSILYLYYLKGKRKFSQVRWK